MFNPSSQWNLWITNTLGPIIFGPNVSVIKSCPLFGGYHNYRYYVASSYEKSKFGTPKLVLVRWRAVTLSNLPYPPLALVHTISLLKQKCVYQSQKPSASLPILKSRDYTAPAWIHGPRSFVTIRLGIWTPRNRITQKSYTSYYPKMFHPMPRKCYYDPEMSIAQKILSSKLMVLLPRIIPPPKFNL